MKLRPPKNKTAPKSFWQRIRIYFRRFRAVVWTLVLLAIVAGLWLDVVGLPGFVKRPLLEKLRARGIELQFTNLRLSWYRGFVAYNVRFGGDAGPAAPQFSARRIEIPFNSLALRHFDFQVTGLVLSDGRLVWPVNGSNQPPRQIIAENINASIRFQPDDEWQLDNFQARVAGVAIFLNGSLAHASAMRDWKSLHPAAAAPSAPVEPDKLTARLRQLADTLDRLKFSKPPELRLGLYGDARDPRGFKLAASFIAADAVTPWGAFGRTRLTVRSAGFSETTNAVSPGLTFVRVQTQIDGGGLDLQATLNVASREVHFAGASDFDIQKIRPLLSEKADRWLGQFSWEKPPRILARGDLVLPPWTNRPPDWRAEVASSLRLEGEFAVGRAAFREVPALAATSHVGYSNQVWRLPDLLLTRPEGRVRVAHWTDGETRDYYWRIQGPFDLKIVRSFLEPQQQRGLDLLGLTAPPVLDVELWGRWLDHDRIGFKGAVAASNFTFRGESIASLRTAVEYTNLFLRLTNVKATRGTNEHAEADGVVADFAAQRVYLTNAVARMDVMALTRAIGPKTAAVMAPYQFLQPPSGHVNGWFSTVTGEQADMHFTAEGGPFRWMKFNSPHITGDIFWRNQSLLITNVQAEFYGGHLAGWTDFDFTPDEGNAFRFDLSFNDTGLGPLIADLTRNTNQLEGIISGRVAVHHGNTADWKTMAGNGHIALRDGLLWEIPLFGLFAPVLNTVWPNLGSGRASEGSATFVITNGAVHSDDLELKSPMMRMQYRGAVDFAGNLHAHVEAELLRSTPVFGPLVSAALWPITKAFEYKVTGTLGQPKIEPLYIPKPLLIPFHPIQSLRELFNDKPAATNAPPGFMKLTPDAP